jgi:hypothetical protein
LFEYTPSPAPAPNEDNTGAEGSWSTVARRTNYTAHADPEANVAIDTSEQEIQFERFDFREAYIFHQEDGHPSRTANLNGYQYLQGSVEHQDLGTTEAILVLRVLPDNPTRFLHFIHFAVAESESVGESIHNSIEYESTVFADHERDPDSPHSDSQEEASVTQTVVETVQEAAIEQPEPSINRGRIALRAIPPRERIPLRRAQPKDNDLG